MKIRSLKNYEKTSLADDELLRNKACMWKFDICFEIKWKPEVDKINLTTKSGSNTVVAAAAAAQLRTSIIMA